MDLEYKLIINTNTLNKKKLRDYNNTVMLYIQEILKDAMFTYELESLTDLR